MWASAACAWTQTVEVRHDDELCVSYQARMSGAYLVVRATLGSGWHTFAMDNKVRADKKLEGKNTRKTAGSGSANLRVLGVAELGVAELGVAELGVAGPFIRAASGRLES